MRDNLKYAQQKGAVDSDGATHKIGAYVAVPVSTTMLLRALWLCDEVAMGFNVPESAMEQFQAGKPWTVVKGHPDHRRPRHRSRRPAERPGTPRRHVGRALAPELQFLLSRTATRLWGFVASPRSALTGGKTLEEFRCRSSSRRTWRRAVITARPRPGRGFCFAPADDVAGRVPGARATAEQEEPCVGAYAFTLTALVDADEGEP